MFFHHKDLAYTVRVDKPNPVFARMLQQAIGGPEGEMRVMNQYLFQGMSYRGPARYRDMLMSTATEEIGHIEVLATAVSMTLRMPPPMLSTMLTYAVFTDSSVAVRRLMFPKLSPPASPWLLNSVPAISCGELPSKVESRA